MGRWVWAKSWATHGSRPAISRGTVRSNRFGSTIPISPRRTSTSTSEAAIGSVGYSIVSWSQAREKKAVDAEPNTVGERLTVQWVIDGLSRSSETTRAVERSE